MRIKVDWKLKELVPLEAGEGMASGSRKGNWPDTATAMARVKTEVGKVLGVDRSRIEITQITLSSSTTKGKK